MMQIEQQRKQHFVQYHWKYSAHWNGLKSDLKRLLKHLFRGGALISQKI